MKVKGPESLNTQCIYQPHVYLPALLIYRILYTHIYVYIYIYYFFLPLLLLRLIQKYVANNHHYQTYQLTKAERESCFPIKNHVSSPRCQSCTRLEKCLGQRAHYGFLKICTAPCISYECIVLIITQE